MGEGETREGWKTAKAIEKQKSATGAAAAAATTQMNILRSRTA